MLSRTAEYALRAIVWLSGHPESSVTGHALATATQVPPDYLAKVMQGLVRAGLVEAQRGKNGGFSLVSTPGDVTILDVINAVEPVRRGFIFLEEIPPLADRNRPQRDDRRRLKGRVEMHR